MSHFDDDVTVVLYQPEAGGPLEVMPQPEVSNNISLKQFKVKKLGINPLLDEFSTLIYLLSCLDSVPWVEEVEPFKEMLEKEIIRCERTLEDQEIERAVILVLKYCICLAIDEAVLRQEWGQQSNWSQQSLLTIFFNETSGGEKFFAILERLKQDPKRYHHVIEFLYLLLQMGFTGRYGVEERGRDKITDVINDIYDLIKQTRTEPEQAAKIDNIKPDQKYTPLRFVISPKMIAGFTGITMLLMYAATHFFVEYKYQSLLTLLSDGQL